MAGQNQVAIVTGASRGLGRAVALELASMGYCLTLCARTEEGLERTANDVRAVGGKALAVQADLRCELDIANVFDKSTKKWGRLDCVINNAAVQRDSTTLDGLYREWSEMLQVNVLAVALISQISLRHFDVHTGGHIITVTSTSAYRIRAEGGFYPITKFALRGLMLALRNEVTASGNPTRVSTIAPGRISRGSLTKQAIGGPDRSAAYLSDSAVAAGVRFILTTDIDSGHMDLVLTPKVSIL